MLPEDLNYSPLKARIAKEHQFSELAESAAFLAWFLENIYRLDSITARDAICDKPQDKGIDGIYVDEDHREVHFFQSKLRQKDNTALGDTDLKNFVASVQQFSTGEGITQILEGNAHSELKRLIKRIDLQRRLDEGFELQAIFVTNGSPNTDALQYQTITPMLHLYGREDIAREYIDLDSQQEKKREFTFDVSYVEPMVMSTGEGRPTMYAFPAQALQLVHMEGIDDGTLFNRNVRYGLGSTSVNRSIKQSIEQKHTHPDFVLFHNGIIILCESVDDSVSGKLTIHNYWVVNGAQSLTSFSKNKAKLTNDLRVMVRVIAVLDESLANTITENSNNQNAVRPRDLKSNDKLMTRLQKEVNDTEPAYFFEIKRGESSPPGRTRISNEEMARALLSFDLQEPWRSHIASRLFDERYSDIFGRPVVNAQRIVWLYQLMSVAADVKVEGPMGTYGLTQYFLLYVLSRILKENPLTQQIVEDPSRLSDTDLELFMDKCQKVLKTVILDLNYEADQDADFDYRTVFKSQERSKALADKLVLSYEKDVKRNKAESFEDWDPQSYAPTM